VKSFTAKDAEDAKEKKSLTAKDAKETIIETKSQGRQDNAKGGIQETLLEKGGCAPFPMKICVR
jgi:hypothetical protein